MIIKFCFLNALSFQVMGFLNAPSFQVMGFLNAPSFQVMGFLNAPSFQVMGFLNAPSFQVMGLDAPGYVKMLHLLPARMKYSHGRSRGKIKLDRIVLNLNMYVLITNTCQFISNRNKEDALQVIASHNRLSLEVCAPQ